MISSGITKIIAGSGMYLLTLLNEQDVTQGQFFMQILTGLNSEFFFSYINAIQMLKSPVCPTILLIAGGRIVRYIPFPKILALCEMQTALSRI